MARKPKATDPFMEPEFDHHNNPVWKIPAVITIHRSDNSLSLQSHAGSLQGETKAAQVSNILGGFVFGLSVVNLRKGKPVGDSVRYALDCKPLLEKIIELDNEFRKVPKRELLRKPPAKKDTRRK